MGGRLVGDAIVRTTQLVATMLHAGRYVITLERAANDWKIRGITLHLAYEEGDRRPVDVAKQRVAAGSGGRVGQN